MVNLIRAAGYDAYARGALLRRPGHGLIQPRVKELISSDLIHTNKEADEMMADLIARRLSETLAALPQRR